MYTFAVVYVYVKEGTVYTFAVVYVYVKEGTVYTFAVVYVYVSHDHQPSYHCCEQICIMAFFSVL